MTGLVIVAIFSYFNRETTREQLIVAIVGLGAITLIFGLLLILLSARATVAPIRAVKAGMSRIEEGDLDAAVVVYDGTELGELQSGSTGWPTVCGSGNGSATCSGGTWATTSRRQRSSSPASGWRRA